MDIANRFNLCTMFNCLTNGHEQIYAQRADGSRVIIFFGLLIIFFLLFVVFVNSILLGIALIISIILVIVIFLILLANPIHWILLALLIDLMFELLT